MSTYTQLLYHMVFSTHQRKPTLSENGRSELFAFIFGLLKNKNCHLYRINGMEDHLHIFTHIHPTIAVSSLIKDIKLASSDMIKRNRLFDDFEGWQKGYGAFTVNYASKDKLIAYIKNQQEHHQKVNFLDEYKKILEENGIEFDEKYLLWLKFWHLVFFQIQSRCGWENQHVGLIKLIPRRGQALQES